jgi:hypothetical protein
VWIKTPQENVHTDEKVPNLKSLLDFVKRCDIKNNGILSYITAKNSKLPQPTSDFIHEAWSNEHNMSHRINELY